MIRVRGTGRGRNSLGRDARWARDRTKSQFWKWLKIKVENASSTRATFYRTFLCEGFAEVQLGQSVSVLLPVSALNGLAP